MLDIFVITNQPSTRILKKYPHATRIGGVSLTPEILKDIASKAKTKSFYIIREDPNIVTGFDFSIDIQYEDDKIHVWERKVDVMLMTKDQALKKYDLWADRLEDYDTSQFFVRDENLYLDQSFELFATLEEGVKESKTFFFYVLDLDNAPSGEIPYPDLYHRFRRYQSRDGLTLAPKYHDPHIESYDHECVKKLDHYDVFFISYSEPNASDNFNLLRMKAPEAKHVFGIKGIHNAHKVAASQSRTSMFYVVDADARVLDSFDFKKKVENTYAVHVWRSINPVNCLTYGYGGIKLFPTIDVRSYQGSGVDFTTSVSKWFVPVNEISNITAFNCDPFTTWKSAFRECVKLSSSVIERQVSSETQKRLDIWCSVGKDQPFGDFCLKGAQMGRMYGYGNRDNPEALSKINDFAWLKEKFESEVL